LNFKQQFQYTVRVKSYKSRILLLALTLSVPAWCGSTVSSYSGNIGFINTPPSSLMPGAVENNLKALLFMEDTDLTFASAITVDATAPGVYQSKASLTPGSIAAGTPISDAYIHADPVTSGTTFTGSVTFNSNILGLIVRNELRTLHNPARPRTQPRSGLLLHLGQSSNPDLHPENLGLHR
jgi:hypothetical protein